MTKEQKQVETTRAMVKELQTNARCQLSWVDIGTVYVNNIAHSGTAAHQCSLDRSHTGWCKCACDSKNLNK